MCGQRPWRIARAADSAPNGLRAQQNDSTAGEMYSIESERDGCMEGGCMGMGSRKVVGTWKGGLLRCVGEWICRRKVTVSVTVTHHLYVAVRFAVNHNQLAGGVPKLFITRI